MSSSRIKEPFGDARGRKGCDQERKQQQESGTRSLHPMLGQPLLPSPLGFSLLGLFPDAGLLVVAAPLELAEESLAGELLLGNLQCFFDVIVKNLDFHQSVTSILSLESRAQNHAFRELKVRTVSQPFQLFKALFYALDFLCRLDNKLLIFLGF